MRERGRYSLGDYQDYGGSGFVGTASLSQPQLHRC